MSSALRLVLALALLALAGGAVGRTAASFTAAESEPASDLRAATVALQAGATEGQELTPDAMRPGTSRTVPVAVHNRGDVAADLHLRRSVLAPTSRELASVLRLRLERCDDAACADPAVLWGGSVDDLRDVPAGRLAAGERRTLRLVVAWPETADSPDLQGASATLGLRWALIAGGSS